MARYSEEDERKLLEMLAERVGADEAAKDLSERMESPTDAARIVLDTIQGLLELNLALFELLLHREVLSEDDVLAAFEEMHEKMDTDMGTIISGSALDYIQDGDTRLVRIAGIMRRVRAARQTNASE